MDIFFQDPNEIPLPPGEVRIRELRAEAWPDGRRVRVTLEVDPFQARPCAELEIRSPDGQPAAKASVIESMTRQIELTLHLRGAAPPGNYTLLAVLYYQAALPEPGGQLENDQLGQPQIVDRRQIDFLLPSKAA